MQKRVINSLLLNSPTPFTQSTQIEYQVVENAQNAILTIYNMNGTQLKSITISAKGAGTITLNGNEFGAGMYMYSLIVDGRVIDTKQMVLTE